MNHRSIHKPQQVGLVSQHRAMWTAILVALVLSFAGVEAYAQPARLDRRLHKSGEEMLRAFRPVVEKASQATVRIRKGKDDVALGVIVASDGLILTKASEVSEIKETLTAHLADGRVYPARLVGRYDRDDVAMLKVEATGLPVIEWADEPVEVGQWAVTVGAGADPVAVGIVSVKERRVPEPAVLGIQLSRTDDAARVQAVFPDTGAAKAGLQPNDIITMIADRPVRNGDELINYIQEFRPGDAVRVNLLRGGEPVEVEVILSPRPMRQRSRIQNQLGGELSERNYGFERAFQHDTVLRPSDCGGPLVNLDGKAVGLNIARSGRTESYALPVPLVQRIISEFREGRHAVAPAEPPAEQAASELTASQQSQKAD